MATTYTACPTEAPPGAVPYFAKNSGLPCCGGRGSLGVAGTCHCGVGYWGAVCDQGDQLHESTCYRYTGTFSGKEPDRAPCEFLGGTSTGSPAGFLCCGTPPAKRADGDDYECAGPSACPFDVVGGACQDVRAPCKSKFCAAGTRWNTMNSDPPTWDRACFDTGPESLQCTDDVADSSKCSSSCCYGGDTNGGYCALQAGQDPMVWPMDDHGHAIPGSKTYHAGDPISFGWDAGIQPGWGKGGCHGQDNCGLTTCACNHTCEGGMFCS